MTDLVDERRVEWDELEMTRAEFESITEAFKRPEFRKVLAEYAEEVRSPEARRQYQNEIAQLERQRGYEVTFVDPEPGYVIKTSIEGKAKCFVNVGKSDKVAKPSSQPVRNADGSHGLNWSIPHTLLPPRTDWDNRRVRCKVFDVVFHPDALYIASKNEKFKRLLNDTALDGVEKNFKVKLDRNNLKFPNLKYKGTSEPAVIRKPCEIVKSDQDIDEEIYQKLMSNYDEKRTKRCALKPEKTKKPSPPSTFYKKSHNNPEHQAKPGYTVPKYVIKHQNALELDEFRNCKDAKIHSAIPRNLVIEVQLPLLGSAADTNLDVQERHLSLKSERPARYHLELPLSYRVDPDGGNAKFDIQHKKLTVSLPVIRELTVTQEQNREDSGVESDHGASPTLEKSSDHNQEEEEEEEEEEDSDGILMSVAEDPEIGVLEEIKSFMNPNIKYTLPPYMCNRFQNLLAVTIHAKNVDTDSITHRMLDNDAGFHILLTNVGTGFFPVYMSLCMKFGEGAVVPGSLVIEPWDNNVVLTITMAQPETLENYLVGLDENLMESKDFSGWAAIKKKLDALEEKNPVHESNTDDVNVGVVRNEEKNEVVIRIRPRSSSTDDDECEHDSEPGNFHGEKRLIVSESSGDELPTISRTKGILKGKRSQYSRSISESSIEDSSCQNVPSSSLETGSFKSILKSRPIHCGRSGSDSSIDDHGVHFSSLQNEHCVPYANSDSEFSGLKKTVRFNSVVSRQLYRSNSSILGQRKKNQRKMRNKKRSLERRLSESEASETEENKFKVEMKNSQVPDVRPILRQNKKSEGQKTASIDIENGKVAAANKRKSSGGCSESKDETENNSNGFEFKSDLLFELDM